MRVVVESPIGLLGVELDRGTVVGVDFGAAGPPTPVTGLTGTGLAGPPAPGIGLAGPPAPVPGLAGPPAPGIGLAGLPMPVTGLAGEAEAVGDVVGAVLPVGGAGGVSLVDGGTGVVGQLAGYFAGAVTEFTVPFELRGGSAFERAVWGEIAQIPYGEMVTYGAIATALGDPGAARAVGTACNHNPVPVIVPCHRVVGAGGKMVGFGGGLERKRRLLELEARVTLERLWG